MIFLNNVSHSYDNLEVLRNCSLQFEAGDVNLLIGPNASGKTTMALIISHLLKPTRGTVVFPRGNIKNIRKEMGFLFQFPEDLFFNDTVYDEIAYGVKKHGLTGVKEKVETALEQVSLSSDFMERSPFELSEGEKRLVALASVLAIKPSWLILDEPFSGLDWIARRRVIEIIKKLKGQVGIILISREIDEIIEYVDVITLLVEGRVIFSSTPEDAEWDEVYRSGCDIPYAVKVSRKLREKGIDIPVEYSIERLVLALKKR